jgi:hypothetical protein
VAFTATPWASRSTRMTSPTRRPSRKLIRCGSAARRVRLILVSQRGVRAATTARDVK